MITSQQRRSLLLVSYYFPPMGLGGVQRALKFARYLPEFGWDVTVIAPKIRDYLQFDLSLLEELPDTVRVERVRAWSPSQSSGPARSDLSSLRWIHEWIRWPDDKIGFAFAATRRARQLHAQRPFDILLTTSPPPSTHSVGLRLHRGIPWIADFRDPWLVRCDDWGPTRLHRRHAQALRRRIVSTADRIVAVNQPLAHHLEQDGPNTRVTVIHNGYDEAHFIGLMPRPANRPFTICCYGTFTPNTDPEPIFGTVAAWSRQHPDQPLRLVHVGATFGIDVAASVRHHGLESVYEDCGYLDHRAAVRELVAADAVVISLRDDPSLMLTIPGRIFEALRALRPVMLFASPDNATAQLLNNIPGCRVVSPNDPHGGLAAIEEASRMPRMHPARTVESIRAYDRRDQTRVLASLCDDVIAQRKSGRLT